MHWLAFLVTIIYIPEITGAVIHPGWALLSITLPWMIWERVLTWPQVILFLSFWAYACASLFWAEAPILSVDLLWQLSIFLLAFWAGARQFTLEKVAIGFAIGLTLSSLLTIPQYLGWHEILAYDVNRPAGLVYNPLTLSNSIALTIALLATYQRWRYIPLLLPGLILPHERAGLVALFAFFLVWLWQRYRWPALALLLLVPLAWLVRDFEIGRASTFADPMRWLLWKTLASHLFWWGHGVDAVDRIAFLYNRTVYFPEYAHNEYLDWVYQYGLGALPLLLLLALPLRNVRSMEYPAYVSFLLLGFFSIPLHNPITSLAGGLIAGCASADYDLSRYLSRSWRSRLLVWLAASRSAISPVGRGHLPVQPNPST